MKKRVYQLQKEMQKPYTKSEPKKRSKTDWTAYKFCFTLPATWLTSNISSETADGMVDIISRNLKMKTHWIHLPAVQKVSKMSALSHFSPSLGCSHLEPQLFRSRRINILECVNWYFSTHAFHRVLPFLGRQIAWYASPWRKAFFGGTKSVGFFSLKPLPCLSKENRQQQTSGIAKTRWKINQKLLYPNALHDVMGLHVVISFPYCVSSYYALSRKGQYWME